jgi:hypothetical protein
MTSGLALTYDKPIEKVKCLPHDPDVRRRSRYVGNDDGSAAISMMAITICCPIPLDPSSGKTSLCAWVAAFPTQHPIAARLLPAPIQTRTVSRGWRFSL